MDSNKCIEHLLAQLREQHRSLWREKLAVARLQREVAQRTSQGAMQEKLIHELEEERHLRLQSEERLREVTLESERNRIQMLGLQQQFSRMEETVRSLLQSQGSPEQKKEEPAKITAYQERVSEEERKEQAALGDLHVAADEDSRSEHSSVEEGKEDSRLLLKRLKALEAENSALALENENQREQYERCLDEVANQVVRALLTQKDLREECVKLKTRVFDLEQQNRALSILFQQRVRPASDVLLQEHLQNAKSGTPALKHSGSGLVIPDHLCPRNSCSSGSELSLSSTCSEYSSGSSCTWQDRKLIGKRQSSQIWDKRLSIDSSLPSGFASPADELPPTRIKESHILEGLRKLQKRKVFLDSPSSVISKWGYKDCMNSNEGIYSPGIKNSSLKEYPPCQPPGMGIPCQSLRQTFIYDANSHEDAHEDFPSSALPLTAPSQGCKIQGSKLTHSVSDSLFNWEPHNKYFAEGTASVYTREMPERLARCASHCPLERKLCPSIHLPWVQRDRDPHSQGHGRVFLNLQLSDTDDNETLQELYIGSSDERSPSDLSLTGDTDKSMENLEVEFRKSECGFHDMGEEERPAHLETSPKAFSFIKQQRVVKRTSSEECVTVIFDAENGEPVEFSSHQAGVVTVTRDEISISSAPPGASEELTELSPQGITHLQPGATTRDYPFLKRPEEEIKKSIPKDENNILTAPNDSFSSRTIETQNSPRPKLEKPTHGVAWKSNSRSVANMGVYSKQGLTKIPSRGKSSPQKSTLVDPMPVTLVPSSGLVTLEKIPASPTGKLSQCIKVESPGSLYDVEPESHIPKLPTQLPHIPKISNKNWVQCPKSQAGGIQSRHLTGKSDNGESPMRAKGCGSEPQTRMRSPSPPTPPGRSVSLLVRPSYDYPPLPSPAKPETRVPGDTVSTGLKSPPLKGSSAPLVSSSAAMSEIQKKKLSVVSRKSALPPALPSTQAVVHSQYPEHTSSSPFAVMASGPPKVSPKRGIPKPSSPHQSLGTTHVDTDLEIPKTCPSSCELLEVTSCKNLSPGRKGQSSDSTVIPQKPSLSGANESLTPQVNSSSFSSSSCRNQGTSKGGQNPPEKGPKTRLPVGLKVLMKSPQLLRKTSMVPGKQEKDSLNEASRSSVTANKSNPEDSKDPESLETSRDERSTALLGLRDPDSLARGLGLESAMPELLESSISRDDGRDGVDSRAIKRSFSSSKPHLKPALGMNGAKARSQSFSIHLGEKPSTPPTEGPGKIRTQIITNTAERGNSLTRQNISTEGSPSKTPSVSTSGNLPNAGRALGNPFSRQGSLCSTGSSSSQHGSPSKLPLRMLTRPEGLLTPGVEDQQFSTQEECPGRGIHEQSSSDHHMHPSTISDCPQSLQVPGRMQRPSNLETCGISKLETSGRHPEASPTGTSIMSPEAPLSPSIEEKVMLCIQENVEKGQVQTKPASVEVKPRAGPSFTSWFGFRKSRLPALSSRRMEASKSKVEKKDTKLKSERKKEKKKAEVQSKIENELSKGIKKANGQSPEDGLQSTESLKASQDIYNQMKSEPRNRPSPAVCSTKDAFMTELLNRVDKRAALQTESGSKGVSCRSKLEGTSQGSCFASGSVSTQGSQKKNIKTKVDMEKPRGSLGAEVDEDVQEDEEDRVADATLQSHVIESNCQMRTLDSGIGTFPLPDSGNRSIGRYICQQDSPEDSDPLLPLQPAPSMASPARAQTLDREVPSSSDSQSSSESTIVHSISDPSMMARGMRASQSHLPKPTSSGKSSFEKPNAAESKAHTGPSFEYAEDAVTSEPLSEWRGEDATTETQELKQVEETKEDPENRLSEISLESFNKFNSNTVILLEKEKSPSEVEGQKEETSQKTEVSLSSSERPGVDHVESLSDSLYDSFSSCASQASNET